MTPVLYLFDIDGTLVDMTPAHLKAYRAAYKKVAGIKVDRHFLLRQFGKVEREIQEAVFRHYGLPDNGRIDKVTKLYISGISRAVKSANIRLLPGVRKLLNCLKAGRQQLGVVTGNHKRVGEAILRKTKLHGYFRIYSYGEVKRRAQIVRNAIKMAKKKGIKFDKAVVIGDSPFDVRAGKENKAITVAVATGRYSLSELKKEKPSLLLKSLGDYEKILKLA